MLPFFHSAVLSLAEIIHAVVNTGKRLHDGIIMLAKVVNTLQQARTVPACLHFKCAGVAVTGELCQLAQLGLLFSVCVIFWRGHGAAQWFDVPALALSTSVKSLLVLVRKMLLDGALRYPAEGPDYMSPGYTWQDLVPDVAALVRSVCVAMEAWTQGLEPNQHTVLGLQLNVRPSLSFALHHAQTSP